MTESEHTLIDINKATLTELTTIRGIGPGLAERIVALRPFADLKDLVRVPGINEIKLQTLLPFIMLAPKKSLPEPQQPAPQSKPAGAAHMTRVGNTEAFVFLEDRNERQDALLIIFGGFILGLLLLMLRRARR